MEEFEQRKLSEIVNILVLLVRKLRKRLMLTILSAEFCTTFLALALSRCISMVFDTYASRSNFIIIDLQFDALR